MYINISVRFSNAENFKFDIWMLHLFPSSSILFPFNSPLCHAIPCLHSACVHTIAADRECLISFAIALMRITKYNASC